jgi:hypothetical protein
MRDVAGALDFLERQRSSGSTAWHNMCESLCRQAYGLPAHYSSANLHAAAIPSSFRHAHEPPRAGDLVLMVNGTYGHIVIATGKGWQAYTNDYGGRGRVTLVADLRDLVPWCGASSWFVADAWWSSSNYLRTHEGDDDMLDDKDIKKIAEAVWSLKRDTYPDRSTYGLVVDAKRAAEAARDQTRPTPPSPTDPVAITPADLEAIATRTADLLAERLRA